VHLYVSLSYVNRRYTAIYMLDMSAECVTQHWQLSYSKIDSSQCAGRTSHVCKLIVLHQHHIHSYIPVRPLRASTSC
jgi:hypothetical protein